MKNLVLSLALAAMCGSLPALAENDERRFPNDNLGKCLTFYSDFTTEATPERSFSVLLYQTPESSNQEKEYTLKLLLPEQPDKETEKAFMKMKTFVENLRHNAYNPFYTADFRLMTGRYYHVTVNKCGWLVKDYMTL